MWLHNNRITDTRASDKNINPQAAYIIGIFKEFRNFAVKRQKAMTELSSHIAYLLRHHDCVVMPGIGAFVAVSREAEFSTEENLAIPPRREIMFNGAITTDDGLLNWSFSRHYGTNYEQAASIATSQIAEAGRRLRIDGVLQISRVGILTRSRDGRITFTPESARTLPSLPQLRLKHFEQTPLIALHIEHRSQERSVAVVKVPFRKRMLAAAASAALLLGLGFTISTPISVETAHTASIASVQFSTPEQIPAIAPLPAPEGLRLCISMPAEGPMTRPEPPAAETPARYALVVASLPSRALAEEFIRSSGDQRLKILDKDGKFRIYITDGTTQSEVSEKAAAIADLHQAYPDAWMCRK